MSNYSTVETDKAVIRVYLTDGTMKSFLVTQSQTPNAVKFMVCKKLGLDVKEFNIFGLYVIEGDSSACNDVSENPFSLHVKWNSKSNNKSKFLFKRTDEPWPQKPQEVIQNTSSAAAPSPHESGPVSNDGNSYAQDNDSYNDDDGYGIRDQPRGFGFGVTAEQLEAQKAAAANTNRSAQPGMSAKAQSRLGLIGWMNKSLEHLDLKISNLTTDMSDGVIFFRLLELITHKTLKGWHTSPVNMMLKLDNLNMFLRILGYFGIKISGVSPEDIFSGNENIITAILLLMIKKYTPSLQLEAYSEYASSTDTNSTAEDEDLMTPPSDPAPQSGRFMSPSAPTQSHSSHADDMGAPPAEEAPSPPGAARAQGASLPNMALNSPHTMDSNAQSAASSNGPMQGATPTFSNGAPNGSPLVPRPASGVHPVIQGRNGRTRSRMVTPDEQAQIAIANSAAPLPHAYIAKAPPKYTVDPTLTPDLSDLLGPPVAMPLNDRNLATGPSMTPPPATASPTPVNSAKMPVSTVAPTNTATGPQTARMNSPQRLPGTPSPTGSPGPQIAQPAKRPSNPAVTAKTTAPVNNVGGAKKVAPPMAGPAKLNGVPGVKKVGAAGPVKLGLVGGAAKKQPMNGPSRMASRPLPVPLPRSEPREEMDITFVPQDAVQDTTMPSIEIDFSNPVPGSEGSRSSHRTRASTISNINTNVFDIDAFSDMEDLLIGLANGI